MSNAANRVHDHEDLSIAVIGQMFDAVSQHFIDNCPDDQNWEDFDPELDELRSSLDELHQFRARKAPAPYFLTEDGYVLKWAPATASWKDGNAADDGKNDLSFHNHPRDHWPVDAEGVRLSGRQTHTAPWL